jgi:integrase
MGAKMAKKDPFSLGTDARGNFKRAIGWKLEDGEYKTHTFYLGRDRGAAGQASFRLEECWNAVYDRWHRLRETTRAQWDAVTLEIAKGIAAGRDVVEVQYPHQVPEEIDPSFPETFSRWLMELRSMFSKIRIECAQKELAKRVDSILGHQRQAHQYTAEAFKAQAKSFKDKAELAEIYRTGTVVEADGKRLADALQAYREFIKTKYISPEDGMVTTFGNLVLRRLTHIENHLADEAQKLLSAVGATFLEKWLTAWGNRPTTKKGKPCSRDWAKGCIKTIRDFVRWLNRSDDFQWEKPRQYEVLPITIRETSDEIAEEETVKRYLREEIAVLWEYANPRDRVYFLLGINCGFGLGEVATLRTKQIHYRGERAFIIRRRRKTKVWGRWELWPETVKALKWYMEKVRPQSDSPYVFLTDKGRALATRTKSGNPTTTIPNAWNGLHERIAKDKEDFPKLTFNKLRKTGATWMRRKSDQLADLYLAHGERKMVDHYAPKMFRPVTRALRQWHKQLEPMFATVADPFPEEKPRAVNVILPLSKIRRIQSLRKQGFVIKRIAEEVGVTTQTVCRYVPRIGKGQKVQPQGGDAASE